MEKVKEEIRNRNFGLWVNFKFSPSFDKKNAKRFLK